MFDPAHPISSLRPAAYNPRRIRQAQFDSLRESVRFLGVVKPVIISNGTIIAGHQRTKAMTAEGWQTTPAHIIGEVSTAEEIRFNQLHNGSDIDDAELGAEIPRMPIGWHVIQPANITFKTTIARGAVRRQEIMRLLTKHGPWGASVATEDGEVISSADYAVSCKTLGLPLHVCVISNSKRELALKYLAGQYGEYSYEHLPRQTWGQALAQMNRLNGGGKAEMISKTYENIVIPNVTKQHRILDFGAGKLAYVKRLKGAGYNIRGIEFYLQRNGKIAHEEVNRHIDRLCQDVCENGLFDVVICDSVLNSVDTVEAERNVMMSLSALCKRGGTIIFSGRSLDFETSHLNHKTYKGKKATSRHVQFLDENNITAIFSAGIWRYQKFHNYEHIRDLCGRYIGTEFQLFDSLGNPLKRASKINTSGWACLARNDRPASVVDLKSALEFEFNLPLPHGKRYGRGTDILLAVSPHL